jgi:hypothetical protein
VLYLFQTYIVNVSSKYFKSRPGCCTTRTVAVVAVRAQPWVNLHGFPVQGVGWAHDTDIERDGVWEPCLNATSNV